MWHDKGALAARLGLLLLAMLPAPPAWAWGPLAHKVVARLAQQRLAPATLAALDALRAQGDAEPLRAHESDPAYRAVDRDLGRFFRGPRLDLGLVGSWADGWRNRDRASEAWHFVDLELDGGVELDAAAVREACPRQECVTGQVRAWAAALADAQRDPEERLKALFFLVHLVADLHQPLHCATRHDHGGNRTQVVFFGRPQSLHQVWDSGVLERGRQGADRLQRQLAAGIAARDAYAWRRGTPEDWALESAGLAREVAYGALPAGPQPWRLERDYQRQALPVAQLQLQKAAVRLGWLVDEAMRGRVPFDEAR
jgi:hypothetical protein